MAKNKDFSKARGSLALPLELKNEFRKVCVIRDLKPSDIAIKLFTAWIEKEKKKTSNDPLVVNG